MTNLEKIIEAANDEMEKYPHQHRLPPNLDLSRKFHAREALKAIVKEATFVQETQAKMKRDALARKKGDLV